MQRTPQETIAVCGVAGRLSARIVRPSSRVSAPPLVVLHGISRNPGTLARLFAPEAERTGRCVILPYFSAEDWPVFQRPSRSARPDRALLDLLNRLAIQFPDLAGPVDLFGHSGGAQLAHRVAMLYPHRVAALHLAAAGWYCLPEDSMPYPYGLAEGKSALGLARILLGKPKLILVDGALWHLGEAAQGALWSRQRKSGATVLMHPALRSVSPTDVSASVQGR